MLIPVNTEFYSKKTDELFYGNGINQFPASGFFPGDVLYTAYYAYTYQFENGETAGWRVRTLNPSHEEYPAILSSVGGYPVVSLKLAFSGCTLMKSAPKIPDGVKYLTSAFEHCFSLTKPPVIPDSVTDMDCAFISCTTLETAPIIPENVTTLRNAFENCISLSGVFVCNSKNLVTVNATLFGTSIKAVKGTCSEETKKLLLKSRK